MTGDDRTLRLRAQVIPVGMIAAAAGFAILAWYRRWISDDGLIVVRIVRNILAGHGPVFNAAERAEANTSALWPWLLAGSTDLFGDDVMRTTVVIGWALATAAIVVAMDGTRRWYLRQGTREPIVPAGAFVLIGGVAFWDFATSGLETSLSLFWIACMWWLLVALRPESSLKFQLTSAWVIGLGPLVRPDFTIPSAVFFAAMCAISRPTRRRLLALIAAAAVIPIGYEIFRAGFYGSLVPLPALAKSAGTAQWKKGVAYLRDYVRPCAMWFPIGALGLLGILARRTALRRTDLWIPIAAAVGSALLMTLFVVRVGGDFMHARMLLPPTFAAVLPAMMLPWRPLTRPFTIGIVLWAVAAAAYRGRGEPMASARRVFDERAGCVRLTKTPNPITSDVFITAEGPAAVLAANALRDHDHLLITEGGIAERANPAYPQPMIYVSGRLGTGGTVVPLSSFVVDKLGLANPLGARIEVNQPGLIGHEKSLPWSWIFAEYADPGDDAKQPEGASQDDIAAARRAMKCGELAELFASTRAPMSLRRFWDNLAGSVRRTRLEIPTDPHAAEAKFCRP